MRRERMLGRMRTLGMRALRVACLSAPGMLLLVILPSHAWAVQSHGGSEGLVSHQLGHILFSIGMIYLLYRLVILRQRGAGWGAFKIFLSLLILWNILTFTGHWMNEYVSADQFRREDGHVVAMVFGSFADGVYYLTRLDHLVLVPAMLFLILALKRWRANP